MLRSQLLQQFVFFQPVVDGVAADTEQASCLAGRSTSLIWGNTFASMAFAPEYSIDVVEKGRDGSGGTRPIEGL